MNFGRLLADQIMGAAVVSIFFPCLIERVQNSGGYVDFGHLLAELGQPNCLSFWELPSGTVNIDVASKHFPAPAEPS